MIRQETERTTATLKLIDLMQSFVNHMGTVLMRAVFMRTALMRAGVLLLLKSIRPVVIIQACMVTGLMPPNRQT